MKTTLIRMSDLSMKEKFLKFEVTNNSLMIIKDLILK